MTDYRHNNKYYWHLPEVTSIKSNYKMIVYWTSCNFSGKCTFNCTIVKKVYKTFHFISIFYCFSCGPLIRSHSKKRKKRRKEGGSNKSVTKLKISWKSLRNSRLPIIYYFQCYFCAFV